MATNILINTLVIFVSVYVIIMNYSDAREGANELYHDIMGE